MRNLKKLNHNLKINLDIIREDRKILNNFRNSWSSSKDHWNESYIDFFIDKGASSSEKEILEILNTEVNILFNNFKQQSKIIIKPIIDFLKKIDSEFSVKVKKYEDIRNNREEINPLLFMFDYSLKKEIFHEVCIDNEIDWSAFSFNELFEYKLDITDSQLLIESRILKDLKIFFTIINEKDKVTKVVKFKNELEQLLIEYKKYSLYKNQLKKQKKELSDKIRNKINTKLTDASCTSLSLIKEILLVDEFGLESFKKLFLSKEGKIYSHLQPVDDIKKIIKDNDHSLHKVHLNEFLIGKGIKKGELYVFKSDIWEIPLIIKTNDYYDILGDSENVYLNKYPDIFLKKFNINSIIDIIKNNNFFEKHIEVVDEQMLKNCVTDYFSYDEVKKYVQEIPEEVKFLNNDDFIGKIYYYIIFRKICEKQIFENATDFPSEDLTGFINFLFLKDTDFLIKDNIDDRMNDQFHYSSSIAFCLFCDQEWFNKAYSAYNNYLKLEANSLMFKNIFSFIRNSFSHKRLNREEYYSNESEVTFLTTKNNGFAKKMKSKKAVDVVVKQEIYEIIIPSDSLFLMVDLLISNFINELSKGDIR